MVLVRLNLDNAQGKNISLRKIEVVEKKQHHKNIVLNPASFSTE